MATLRTSLLIIISSLLLTALSTDAIAQKEPLGLYLTWQQDPTTTMTIDWHVIGAPDETRLEYRKQGETLWQYKTGSNHDFPYSKRTIIRVELTDLTPESKYEFRFGEDYKVYTFRTMPEKLTRPLRIAIGGDTMHHQDLFEKTNRQVLPYDPDFIVIGGDLAYADGLPPEEQGIRADPVTMLRTEHPRPGLDEGDNLWYHWFDAYKNTLITDDGRVIPMLVTIGNHEESQGKAPYFFALFAMPGDPGYNVLDFGEYLSFILLDSGHVNPIEGEQTEWLKKVLTERKDFPHLFPVYHVPAWPSARDFNDPRTKPVRDNWVSIFEEHNIRIAFENHDHTYKRTHPLRDGRIQSNGVVYVGDGSWGTIPRAIGAGTEDRNRPFHDGLISFTSSEINEENRSFSEEYWYLTRAESAMHFILLTIDGTHQHLITVDDNGNIIDEYPNTPKPN